MCTAVSGRNVNKFSAAHANCFHSSQKLQYTFFYESSFYIPWAVLCLEKDYTIIIIGKDCTIITKRIEYILEWNLVNPLVCILSVPLSLKGRLKCTNHVNVHKLYAVEYFNTVCSLDYPFQFRIF